MQREELVRGKKISQPKTYGKLTFINGVAVPSDFPKMDIDILETTAPGKLFLSNLDGYPYIMILENDGTPYFYWRMQETFLDFKVQPTGIHDENAITVTNYVLYQNYPNPFNPMTVNGRLLCRIECI